jgi:hypothetical protein
MDRQIEAHLVASTCPTWIEASCGFELVRVKGGIQVEHSILAPPGFGGGELLVCLCGVGLASAKKATGCINFSGCGRNRERNGQESGIVVRGGRESVWRGVEALLGESTLELVEW